MRICRTPGFRLAEAIAARLLVLAAATMLVDTVSALATAAYFTPASWPTLIAAWILLGTTYATIGALAGAALGKLPATYLMLFLALTDVGIVQNPMFGTGDPGRFAALLPGYGPSRVMVDCAFSTNFHTAAALLVGLAWLAALLLILRLTLRRALGTRAPAH